MYMTERCASPSAAVNKNGGQKDRSSAVSTGRPALVPGSGAGVGQLETNSAYAASVVSAGATSGTWSAASAALEPLAMSGLIQPNVASESHDAVAYVSSSAAAAACSSEAPVVAASPRPVDPVTEK
uniref:Uncharacterized protein n=1 Tax=Arundo donax TaxID=35708 RepID=A0A0A9CJQ4_ARUDO